MLQSKIKDDLARAWAPPPRLSVAEWAERFRHLSPEASAEPGPWSNARAPHLVAPMDRLSPHDPAESVVCMFSSQTGKTELALNFSGFIIDVDPGPTLVIQPNVKPMGEAFSKDRINPMVRDTPALRDKVSSPRGRDANSTITHKSFAGGHLTIAGANSPAGLASRPIRYLICDELDRWETTKEGDPLLLARKRLQTFRAKRRSKQLIVSSPTYSDLGIAAEYARCHQQYDWRLGCLHCGEHQRPQLRHFTWDDRDPQTARYACEHCGGIHTLRDEQQVKETGRWVCTRDDGDASAGYWMNQFGSPFARWDDTIAEWLDAQGDSARLQAVINTVMAECWEGIGDAIEPHVLRAREEDYGCECPAGVAVITIGVDCQVDRLELEVVGWGANRESWSLGYHVLPGEPTAEDVWTDLLDLYRTPFRHPSGALLKPAVMCIDSGAWSQHIYEFVKRAADPGIIPIKGAGGMSRDQIDMDLRARRKRTAQRRRNGKPPEILGVDSIKRTVYSYLAAEPGKAGHCHFPMGRSDEYYDQLTGERLVVVQQRGKRPERRWKPVHTAVEALDARCYAYAGLLLHGVENVKQVQAAPQPENAITSSQKKPSGRDPHDYGLPRQQSRMDEPNSSWIRPGSGWIKY